MVVPFSIYGLVKKPKQNGNNAKESRHSSSRYSDNDNRNTYTGGSSYNDSFSWSSVPKKSKKRRKK